MQYSDKRRPPSKPTRLVYNGPMVVWKKVMYDGAPVLAKTELMETNLPQIVVGTGRRIKDLVTQKSFSRNKVKCSVLDE